MKNVVEVGGFPKGGGIEDFGNFSEGFCFKLNVAVTIETYVICCDDKVNLIKQNKYILKYKNKSLCDITTLVIISIIKKFCKILK